MEQLYCILRAEFIRGVVKKWGADPYSLGAFVFAYPHHVRPSLLEHHAIVLW